MPVVNIQTKGLEMTSDKEHNVLFVCLFSKNNKNQRQQQYHQARNSGALALSGAKEAAVLP